MKQKLTLSDRGTHAYQLTVPKNLLKSYKELIRKSFSGNSNFSGSKDSWLLKNNVINNES